MLLNAKIDEKGINCTFSGSIMDMCSMVTLLISNLYQQLPGEVEKDFVKFALTKAFADGLPFAETHEERQKIVGELKSAETVSDIVDKFIESLKGKGLKDD